MTRALALLALIGGSAAVAATLPTPAQVNAQAIKCELDPGQVTWQPGARQIVAIFVVSDIEKDPDADKARASGACLERWAKTLGLHPVLTVQIPEGH